MYNISLFDIGPSIVTLTLSWHMGNMGSAHPHNEVNTSAKCEFKWYRIYRADTIMETDGWADRPTDGRTRQSKSRPHNFFFIFDNINNYAINYEKCLSPRLNRNNCIAGRQNKTSAVLTALKDLIDRKWKISVYGPQRTWLDKC